MNLTSNHPKGAIKKINGECITLIGDDIDTDRIIPARFLKCVDFESLGNSVFADDRKSLNGKHPFDNKKKKSASILIVNSNFGCGSSREHAPQALMRWGIRAIIGESFADIFYSNCLAIGIPCFTLKKNEAKNIQKRVDSGEFILEIDIQKSLAKHEGLEIPLNIKESSKEMFLSGKWDATSTLLSNEYLIRDKIRKLPYLNFNDNSL